MKVRMLLKSGFGAIRHNEVFDATPADAQLGFQVGFLAPVDAEAVALASRERPRPEEPPAPPSRKSFADFCRAVVRKDAAYLARHYDSHFLPAETDHLSPQQKAALAESGGPVGGYTVPAEYAAGMLTVAAENALIRPNATVAAMHSATLQVPYIDMTTPQTASVSPYFGGVQMKWTGESQTRTESEPQFKQVGVKAWELSGSAVVSRPLQDEGDAGALAAYLSTVFGLALAGAEDYACLQGDGVAKPQEHHRRFHPRPPSRGQRETLLRSMRVSAAGRRESLPC